MVVVVIIVIIVVLLADGASVVVVVFSTAIAGDTVVLFKIVFIASTGLALVQMVLLIDGLEVHP